MFKKLLAWMYPFFSLLFWHDFENLTAFQNSMMFSTEEVDTGLLFNGKHVFHKICQKTITSPTGYTVVDATLTLSYIDTLLSFSANLKTSEQIIPFNLLSTSSLSKCKVTWFGSQGLMFDGAASASSTGVFTAEVWYTKA